MHIKKTEEERTISHKQANQRYESRFIVDENCVVSWSAAQFRVKMREAKKLDTFRRTRLTSASKPPPCFDSPEQYRLWLLACRAAAGAAPLHRHKDGYYLEQNYCHDCTQDYRDKMCLADRCIFPETTFKPKTEDGEKFLAGVSHKVQIEEEE